MKKTMKESICIKPTFTEKRGLYVSSYDTNQVVLGDIILAKRFPTKQKALDYMEGFPFLRHPNGSNVNTFTLETVYFIGE